MHPSIKRDLLLIDSSCFLRSQAVVEALRTNRSITSITAEDIFMFEPAEKEAWLKLLQVFRKVVSSGE